MTGGRIYSHSLAKVFPDFEQEAPLERKITHEKISLLAPDACFTVDFSSEAMLAPNSDSYSVLRAPFDQWLASKAEEAGAEAIYGIAVESLVKDETGKVIGVKAGEDEITADVGLQCRVGGKLQDDMTRSEGARNGFWSRRALPKAKLA